jgi:hypothetical protein
LPVESIVSVSYGLDLLRNVDANLLACLAATVGAVLHQNAALTEETTAYTRMVNTWFPRLKIKGTAASFESLGKLVGFDDVIVSPLWSRLSPRDPSDVGSAVNDSDYASVPQCYPAQSISEHYDPFNYRDGPYYAWQAIVNNKVTSSNYYTQVVTGANPWIKAVVVGGSNGTVTHPFSGASPTTTYTGSAVLAGGGDKVKAWVIPQGSDIKFEAIAEGESFNGLELNFSTTGSLCTISAYDRLSDIKYRSSYFDLKMTMDMDKVEEVFGSRSATANADLKANPVTPDGTASSPYTAYSGGSYSAAYNSRDWLGSIESVSVVQPRVQANPVGVRQLNTADLLTAGNQALQSMEEVRPATRFVRKSGVGFLLKEDVEYAAFSTPVLLFAGVVSQTSYQGQLASVVPYATATARIISGAVEHAFTSELSPVDSNVGVYNGIDITSNGTFNFSDGTYVWTLPAADADKMTVELLWHPSTSEVIRDEPSFVQKSAGTIDYQTRPEDDFSDYTLDTVDDYAWRDDLAVGGDLVDLDVYSPTVTDNSLVSLVTDTVFQDQNGVDVSVYGKYTVAKPCLSLVDYRETGKAYAPGQMAIGYMGSFRDLSTYTDSQHLLPNATDYSVVFDGDYALYHVGVCYGQMVADLAKFAGPANSHGLTCWMPFNEHPESGISVLDSYGQIVLSTNGIATSDRIWDSNFGWVLKSHTFSISHTAYKNIIDRATISFWTKFDQTVDSACIQCGQLKIVITSGNVVVYVLNSAGTYVQIISFTPSLSTWYFIFATTDSLTATAGYGTISGIVSSSSVSSNFADVSDLDQTLSISGTNTYIYLHDLRLWNDVKTLSSLDVIRDYKPSPTICPYPLGRVESIDSRDVYGLKVLPCGWAYLTDLPPVIRNQNLGYVQRYNSLASYTGDTRYYEAGINGGYAPPSSYKLGHLSYQMQASGSLSYSTVGSYIPGPISVNDTTGNIVASTNDPSTVGIDCINVFQRYVWANNTDDNKAYRLELDADSSSVWLNASLAGNDAGANSTKFSISALKSASAIVTQSYLAYMYLTSRVLAKVDSTNIHSSWVDSGVILPVSNSVDYLDMPSIINSGGYLIEPTLGKNGILEFTNVTPLPKGRYILTLVTGNVGKVDADFLGFKVNLSIGGYTYSKTLLANKSGYNFSGTDVFDIDLAYDVGSNWLFGIELTNALRDIARNTQRQLRVYSYELRHVSVDPYKVQFGLDSNGNPATPVITLLSKTDALNTPGGWIAEIKSDGSTATTVHESAIVSSSDTMTNSLPISCLLTGQTGEKREDILCSDIKDITGTSEDIKAYTIPVPASVAAPVLDSVTATSSTYSEGDTASFTANANSGSGPIYSYVWTFWDGSTTATAVNSVSKQVNICGDPSNSNTLTVSCDAVGPTGLVSTSSKTFSVKGLPRLLNTITISNNYTYFPFTTVIAVKAYTLSGNSLTFSWPSGVTATTTTESYSAKWRPTDTASVSCLLYTSTTSAISVTADTVLTCSIADAVNGTSVSIDVNLVGYAVSAVHVSSSVGSTDIITDASALPIQRVGADQVVTFTAYANNATSTPVFDWEFYGSNNWSVEGNTNAQIVTNLGNGTYQSKIIKSIAQEIIPQGQTQKTVVAVCTVNVSGTSYTLQIPVILESDQAPGNFTISRLIDGDNTNSVAMADKKSIVYEIAGIDPDGDVTTAMWSVNQDAPLPLTGIYWGPKLTLNSGDYAIGDVIQGSVTLIDRLGGSNIQDIPVTYITDVTSASGQ